MKNLFTITSIVIIASVYGCGNSQNSNSNEPVKSMVQEGAPAYDATRGEGKFTAENVKVAETVDATMAASGEKIASVKCVSCHKVTAEKLVGPGWKGVTKRRTPQWIMNFITNPNPMIDKDPEAQAMLELCLVRMPNQNLSDDDARSLLELLRKNDNAN